MSRPARQEETAVVRRRRSDMGASRNLKLHVPESMKDKEFEYRWINDKPGRVRQLTVEDDWDVVSTEDAQQLTEASEGSVMTRTVDKVSGEKAVLVRKRKDFYEADQREKQKPVDATENALRHGAAPSAEGLSGPTAYVPGGKNTVGR